MLRVLIGRALIALVFTTRFPLTPEHTISVIKCVSWHIFSQMFPNKVLLMLHFILSEIALGSFALIVLVTQVVFSLFAEKFVCVTVKILVTRARH